MIARTSLEVVNKLRTIFYILFIIYLIYLIYDLFYIDSGRYQWTLFAIALILLPFAFEKVETAILAWFDKIVPNHPVRLADKIDDQLFTDDHPNTAATV